MNAMKEPINFDKVENQLLIDFNSKERLMYKITNIETVGLASRKFWVVSMQAMTNGLQFVIYWQMNPMLPANDYVEVQLYKNGPGMVHYDKKRYSLTRADIKDVDEFYKWVKSVIRDFEPELSTPVEQ
jgi:hypothetical protein